MKKYLVLIGICSAIAGFGLYINRDVDVNSENLAVESSVENEVQMISEEEVAKGLEDGTLVRMTEEQVNEHFFGTKDGQVPGSFGVVLGGDSKEPKVLDSNELDEMLGLKDPTNNNVYDIDESLENNINADYKQDDIKSNENVSLNDDVASVDEKQVTTEETKEIDVEDTKKGNTTDDTAIDTTDDTVIDTTEDDIMGGTVIDNNNSTNSSTNDEGVYYSPEDVEDAIENNGGKVPDEMNPFKNPNIVIPRADYNGHAGEKVMDDSYGVPGEGIKFEDMN